MTSTQKISAKHLSFEELCMHTKDLFPYPDKGLYLQVHAHLDAFFSLMYACGPHSRVHFLLNNMGDSFLYDISHHSAHLRMSSPWLRDEDKNLNALKLASKNIVDFFANIFLQRLLYESIWHEKDDDTTGLFFNNITISIKDEAATHLAAFMISAVHASFFNGRSQDDMKRHSLLNHSFIIDPLDSIIPIDSMGTDPKDTQRVYYESFHIMSSLESKFMEFSILR